MSLLSVVRIRKQSEAETLQALKDAGHDPVYFKDWIGNYLADAGKYVASGGAGHTTDIQRAQIFGWSPRAKRTMAGYNPALYEIIPVLIVPVTKEIEE